MRCGAVLGWLVIVAALAGCASAPKGGTLQAVDIEAVRPLGARVAGHCTLDSEAGHWSASTPGRVGVITGADALRVRCRATGGITAGTATVEPRVQGAVWERALAGAGIGAVAGALLGAPVGALTADPACAYPARLRIVLRPAPPDAALPR